METSKTCSYCSKPDALKICGRCRNQPYCSLACQRSDWRRHKATCAPVAPPPPRRTNRLDEDAFRPVATKALATKNTAGCRVGLRNEGNTCYLTCVLQCLTYSPLAGYLLELDVDGSNNMMAELQSHIRKVWKRNELLSRTEPSRIGSEEDSDDSAETVTCKTEDIDVARSLLKRTLHNGRMQDAHEALVDIQAQLLASCGAHKQLKGQALVDWERSTIVHDVFGSDLEQACVCSACGFRSPSTHVEMMLMLNATLGTISASRGAAVPSRHRRDSSPGEEVVGGLFFDFEPFLTASRPRFAQD